MPGQLSTINNLINRKNLTMVPLRPYQARQGCCRSRPHWVLAPIHGDEERGPAKAVRAKFLFVEHVIQFDSIIQFRPKVWHQEVCLDHGRQDPCLQGGSPGIVNSRGDSFMQNWNPTMKFFIFLKNIQHSLCTIFVHFQGVRRHCFSWCWGRWSFRQDGCCRR